MMVGGIVLCGGQSSRMGRPKAWLPFGDEYLLQRVVRVLACVLRPIVVVAAPEQDVPPLPCDVATVRDEERGRGPLQGLAAGLSALQHHCDAAYISSCDVPFLRPEFVARMAQLLDEAAICVPRIDDRYHPLAAVYRVAALESVRELLQQDRLRPYFLFEMVKTRVVEAGELADVDPGLASLNNVNTTMEYEEALRREGFQPSVSRS